MITKPHRVECENNVFRYAGHFGSLAHAPLKNHNFWTERVRQMIIKHDERLSKIERVISNVHVSRILRGIPNPLSQRLP
jgi:hypothetical protein